MPMTEEHKAAIKAGRERAKAARLAAVNQPSLTEEQQATTWSKHEVTYRPFDGDPHSTKWNGITFRANVPVQLDRNNPAHHISQLLPSRITGQNGEILTKHAPSLVFMGDLALANPSFEVDGVRAPKMVNKRVLPKAGHGWAEDHEDEISESTDIDTAAA